MRGMKNSVCLWMTDYKEFTGNAPYLRSVRQMRFMLRASFSRRLRR
jgi:hypothetical protein